MDNIESFLLNRAVLLSSPLPQQIIWRGSRCIATEWNKFNFITHFYFIIQLREILSNECAHSQRWFSASDHKRTLLSFRTIRSEQQQRESLENVFFKRQSPEFWIKNLKWKLSNLQSNRKTNKKTTNLLVACIFVQHSSLAQCLGLTDRVCAEPFTGRNTDVMLIGVLWVF